MRDKLLDFDPDKIETFLKTISTQDFLTFGVHHVAYVKPIHIQGERVFAIHAADGTPLSISESMDAAVTAMKDNDLEQAAVH